MVMKKRKCYEVEVGAKRRDYPNIHPVENGTNWTTCWVKDYAVKPGIKNDSHPAIIIGSDLDFLALIGSSSKEKTSGKRNIRLESNLEVNPIKLVNGSVANSYIIPVVKTRTRSNTGSAIKTSVIDIIKNNERPLRSISESEKTTILKALNSNENNKKRYQEDFLEYVEQQKANKKR